MKKYLALAKKTFSEWSDDKATQMSAALAYYSVFSLGPLLIIAVAVAGFVFGKDTAREGILREIQGTMGPKTSEAVKAMMSSTQDTNASGWMAVVGIVTLLVTASGVFGQLKDSMNVVWKVKPKTGSGIYNIVKERFLSITMVLGVGFLLLISLVLSTVLAAANHTISQLMPLHPLFWQAVGFLVSFGFVIFLFALIFKFLPDTHVRWRDVWTGSTITALLFTIGKSLLAIYLGRESTSSPFGFAGAFVLLLLWVYYSSLILFLGAEFTYVYAQPENDTLQLASSNKPSQDLLGK